MMSQQQNDVITRVGKGTPAGQLLRNYWQPVALAEELPSERPVKAVRLMGEHFVLFRDEQGRLGMLDRDCPHRGADLASGRLEDGGLRCAFHGWLFDVNGQCTSTPGEPAGSTLCKRIKQRSYEVIERAGVIFAYIGSGTPPAFPHFDCFAAPDEYTFAFKGLFECNWLQALEVGIDPAHASFLHRFFEDEDVSDSYGKQFRGASANSEMPITKVLREFESPEILVNPADYGLRLIAKRAVDDTHMHVRVTNVVFPQAFVIPMSSEMTITQWHVPVDDENCYWFAIFTSFNKPTNKQQMREQRLELYELPEYTSRKNKRNNYGFNLAEQQSQTYTGMGFDINVHDQWAVESQGAIQDRTKEHLGTTDKGIIAYRKLLIDAIEKAQAGEKTFMLIDEAEASKMTGPASIDGIAPIDRWDEYWKESDLERRNAAPWPAAAQS
ncbi:MULTISPECIES: aromatic ring-hydroxylating dioxygenase subunit alpha [Burkholderiaceae]|uniref:Dioxygenase n=1 Tax=Caballeronia zhejiangensis TaxID=871203 RepID=A0A656QAT2_9BURK|nr:MULTISPECIES: aromatic ring-hydroxylating dioxygenase subunit alpha [Burkholderiaceae]KAK43834.1 dioxygenase [Caballeronia jiangsuensis]KDR25883.1 dioxygenase [Caballeronia zhejiangensis]KWU23782.1 ring-hydroxylating oxygenase subunit alpha [Burkholderia cenocepacia]SAL78349.1 Rieske (2Fe-2S) domain-containing protein [Caballeronia peredens]